MNTQEKIDAIWHTWESGYPGIDYPEYFNPWKEIEQIKAVAQGMHELPAAIIEVKKEVVNEVIEQNVECLFRLARE